MPLNIVKIERDDTFKVHREKMNTFIDTMNYNVLEYDKNLDDVKNKQTVRDNLNLYRRDQVWNKGEADARFFEESKLFGEYADTPQLKGGSDSNATIRRKQANNLDMYIKGDLYTRTQSDARYLNEASNLADLPDKQAARNVLSLYTRQETREGSLWNYGNSNHNLDTIIKDDKQQGLYQRSTNGPTGYNYGVVASLSSGSARGQLYIPHYHSVVDDLTNVEVKRSALHVRTGWGDDLKSWEHIITENSGNAYYFRKDNLFNELAGSTRNTDRRTATNNLDVYQKADVWDRREADARFLNESSNLADLPNKQTARDVLSLYTRQETREGSLWGYGSTGSNSVDHIMNTNNIQGYYDVDNKSVVPNFTGYGQYGSLLSFNGGTNKAQIYVPQYYTSTDGLNGAIAHTSAIFVRAGRGTTKRTWDRVITEATGDHRYFEKSNKFSELSGTARATDRRTATNNLDVYQKGDVYNKGEADSRFFNVTGDTINGNIQLNGQLLIKGDSLHLFKSGTSSYIRNRTSGGNTNLQARNNAGSYVNTAILVGGSNPYFQAAYSSDWKFETRSNGAYTKGTHEISSRTVSPEFTDNANFMLSSDNVYGVSDVSLRTIQGTYHQRVLLGDSSNTFDLDVSTNSGTSWTNLFKVSKTSLRYKGKRVYHENDKPNKSDVGLPKVDNYSRADYDGRYTLKVGTGTNTHTTRNIFNGNTQFDTSKGFRLKRKFSSNNGDDVVDFSVDDNGLTLTVDNENDSASSLFNIRRTVANSTQNIFTVTHTSLKHLTHNIFHEGNLSILTPSRLGGGGDSGAYTKAETRALFADVSENLADVNATAARSNLGVYSKSEVDTKHNDTFKLSKRFSEVVTMSVAQRTEVWNNLDVYSRSQIDANFQSGATTYLAKGSNLSDLTDKYRARTNLGLGNASTYNFAGNHTGEGYVGGTDNDISRGDHRHFRLHNIDNRSVNDLPNNYTDNSMTNEFKYSNKVGSGTKVTYTNLLTFNPWTGDSTSHRLSQMGFVSEDQRVKVRFSTGANAWNSWKTLMNTDDTAVNSALLGGKNLAHVLDWNNTTNKPSIAAANHNHNSVYLKIGAKAADSNKLDGLDSSQFLRKDIDQVYTSGRKFHFSSSSKGATLYHNGNVEEGFGTLPNGNDWFHIQKTDFNASTPDSGVVFDWKATLNGTTSTGWSLALRGNNASINGTLHVGGSRVLTTAYGKATDSNLLDGLNSDKFVRRDVDQNISSSLHRFTNGNVEFNGNKTGILWARNSDLAFIRFKNDTDSDTDSYLLYATGDNNNEYHKWNYGAKTTGNDGSTGMELRGKNLKVFGTLTSVQSINSNGNNHTFNSGASNNLFNLLTGDNKDSALIMGEGNGLHGAKLVYTGTAANDVRLIGRESGVDKVIWTARRNGTNFDFKVLPTVNGTTLLTSTATAANSNKLGNVAASAYIRRDVSSSLNSGVTLRFGSQGAILGSKNNKHILHDHGNGSVTLSGDGSTLHLGYNSGTSYVTTSMRLGTDLSTVNGNIKVVDHNTGELSDKGTTLETKYARRNGESNQDFKVKKLVIEDTVEIRKNSDGSIGFYL